MNILFIDNIEDNIEDNISYGKNKVKSLLFRFVGFYINKIKNKKIYYINLNVQRINKNINSKIFKIILKFIFNKEKVYVVLSKTTSEIMQLKEKINKIIPNLVIVSSQNNLYDNDKKYIEDYINENKIDKKEIKILLVIDKLEYAQKRKIEELLEKYKIVDIYATKYILNLKEYIDEINNNLGTVIEIIDKIPKEYYNILLVFSKEYKNFQTKSSFILDYNNSDLDIKSNTYLIYKNNIKLFDNLFNKLGIQMSRYERTKLGKLYIHASRLILDK